MNVVKITTRILAVSIGRLFEHVDASEIVVIQSPVSGRLDWYSTPGIKWQGFGSVTRYPKRSQYWFSNRPDQGTKSDQSVKVRYKDGGHANISGSFAWEMPLDTEKLTALHTKYGCWESIDQQLIRTTAEKAVYMSGPLMSSTESYAERRAEFLNIVEDQLQHGCYVTRTVTTRPAVLDPSLAAIQGNSKTIVEVVRDKNGQPVRQEVSPLEPYGIKTSGLSINEIKYEGEVENQITQQQKAVVEVQIQAAQAKKAEQKALTAEKEGEAEAMASKWKQEVIKAQKTTEASQAKQVAITEAEQKREVAKLEKEAAEFKKQAETLIGEGEAARKRLVMEADGTLEKKLTSWETVNAKYAEALAKCPNLVPMIVMGGNGEKGNSSNALDLIEMLSQNGNGPRVGYADDVV